MFWKVLIPRTIRSYSTTKFKVLEQNNLSNLIDDLKVVLDGVHTKEQVDIKTTMNLLRVYKTEDKEWSKYALVDPTKPYTRNLVANTSPVSTLLILVWQPGQASKIHNHPDSNCFVKVLKGTLVENQYENISTLGLKRKTEVPTGEVTYITDKIGLHQMANKTDTPVVTLHLYVPKYNQCKTFDLTGEERISSGETYYSVEGVIGQ